MAATLTPSTTSEPRRTARGRRTSGPAMPTLPFPELEPIGTSPLVDPSVFDPSTFDPGDIVGATARELHPASGPSVSLVDPTVEIVRPALAGAEAHAAVAAGLAPWNRTSDRMRTERHLRVVPDPTTEVVASPVAPRVSRAHARRGRGALRTVLGGVALALVLALAAVGALQFFGATAAATTPAATTEPSATIGAGVAAAAAPVEAVPPAHREIVVERGDSIWTVARRLQPKGDLRGLVDRLIARNGSPTVSAGQHLDVTGLVD